MDLPKVVITEPEVRAFRHSGNEEINVCAYCRVSTDKNDQKNSLEAQKKYFDYLFCQNRNWKKCDIYSDEGISGTSLRKRDSFNTMISKALIGEYDLIVTRDVSRFSRNAEDCLRIINRLREKQVYIWFIIDGFTTEDESAYQELCDRITASQGESYRTSKKVKAGQRIAMIQGNVFGRKRMFGYRIEKDENGNERFSVIPEEAVVIKEIFRLFAEGKTPAYIASVMNYDYYKNGWNSIYINRILRNEKYVGDLEQGKTYTPNTMDHRKKYNRGQSTKYYIKDHHKETAIIDRELWNKVQTMMNYKRNNERKSEKYVLSGTIICGLCGRKFVAYKKNDKLYWVCGERHAHGKKKENGKGCDNVRISDETVMSILNSDICRGITDTVKEIVVYPDNVITVRSDKKDIKVRYAAGNKS